MICNVRIARNVDRPTSARIRVGNGQEKVVRDPAAAVSVLNKKTILLAPPMVAFDFRERRVAMPPKVGLRCENFIHIVPG